MNQLLFILMVTIFNVVLLSISLISCDGIRPQRWWGQVRDIYNAIMNQSGAVYGAVAYQQGLYDGIRLMAELQQVNCTDCILEKNQ